MSEKKLYWEYTRGGEYWVSDDLKNIARYIEFDVEEREDDGEDVKDIEYRILPIYLTDEEYQKRKK